MSRAPLSQTAEDYLKEVYKLESVNGRATTSALAASLGVSPPSVTSMLKKLAGLKLVVHERYRGVTLTSAGRKAAVEVIRHHRLLEQYLAETLGMPIDAVHAEADRLEHALSEELEARIDETLGFPTHDPHGDPIPDAALNVGVEAFRPLHALGPGERSTVRRVTSRAGLSPWTTTSRAVACAFNRRVTSVSSPAPTVSAESTGSKPVSAMRT